MNDGICSTARGVAQWRARIIGPSAFTAVKAAEESELATLERTAAAMHGSAT